MGQVVHKFSPKVINQMKSFYKNNLENAPSGAIFRAKKNGAFITAYQSGKVLFQGADAQQEANKWGENLTSSKKSATTKKRNKASLYSPPKGIFQQAHVGSDESGTGDYFGPITVASVFVDKSNIQTLIDLGVQDSKKLTDQTVMRLSTEILQLNIPYAMLTLDNKRYNQLQASGWSQGKMKAMLHHHVNDILLKKIENKSYQGIIIDQFCEPSLYKRYIASEKMSLAPKTFFMTKAETYSIAVATASVLARAKFLKALEMLSEQVGFQLLKGASNRVDQLIAQIMKKDQQLLDSCAKLHFSNTEKAKQYL